MDHQFSKERQRIQSVFNLFSLIYPIIEFGLIPQYKQALERLNLPSNLSVLDFATGTGILAAAFHSRGHSVRGLDFSSKLLTRARKKYPQIDFEQVDLFALNVKDMTKVDIVSIGYLLHGVSPGLRKIILQKAADLVSEYVVVFDHCDHPNRFIELIELLEGSHYKEFIASDRSKMFDEVGLKIIEEFKVNGYIYCWLCKKTKDAGIGQR